MRTACVTMVWRDHFFLDQWVRYYGAMVGRESLYVVSHGGEEGVAEIARGCNVIAIPRDEMNDSFNEIRWRMLSDWASGLTRYYDRVLVGDVDEIIISLTPGESVIEYLEKAELGTVTAPAGYEIVPEDDSLLDPTKPVLAQCHRAVVSANFSKPGILTGPARLSQGGHGSFEPFDLRPELALLHLRYLNTEELVQRRKERMAIAAAATERSDRNAGSFMRGWRKSERIRQKVAREFRKAPEVPSADAPGRAREVLENARIRKGQVHRFSLPKVRENAFKIDLDPALRDLF